MPKCPYCNKEVINPETQWKQGTYDVLTYTCDGCGNSFQHLYNNGRMFLAKMLGKNKG